MKPSRSFASDNNAGVHPEVLKSLAAVNQGHTVGYGDDAHTASAVRQFQRHFGDDIEVFFVFNGTAANSLALASLCQSYHSILCSEIAHVETDECGAPEFFSNGTKVLLLPHTNGKIQPQDIEKEVKRRNDLHFPKPRAVTITTATEVGTVYGIDELNAIGKKCKSLGLRLHMDGARFANAVATLNLPAKETSWRAGVDVLCFGGTKNGTHVGDAVVYFNKELASEFAYRCKQAGQLASKMRFLSAAWVGMLQDGAWLKRARHANAMAQLLSEELGQIPEVRLLFPRQANSVFAEMPGNVIHGLWDRGWMFYTFIGSGGSRLMCSWDTTEKDVREFIRDLKGILKNKAKGDRVSKSGPRYYH